MEHQSAPKKGETLISSSFQKIDNQTSESSSRPVSSPQSQANPSSSISNMMQIPSNSDLQSTWIERDPGKRKQLCDYPVKR